ncbi:hypothetical protein GLW20_14165 [Virgibacillus halodenitrificans]|nr:hypothetical protein [Virgibacillus halodenitrificans]
MLKEAISYPNIYVHQMAKKRFWELLLSILGNEAIDEKLEKLSDAKFFNINKFDKKYDSLEFIFL